MTRLTAYATPVALVCLVASLGWLLAWGLRDAGKSEHQLAAERWIREHGFIATDIEP